MHPDTADSYNNIGALYQNQKKYELALINYQRSLEIKIKLLGEMHPCTADSYNNIGFVYYHQEKYD